MKKALLNLLGNRDVKHFLIEYQSHTDQEISKSTLLTPDIVARTMVVKVDGKIKLAVTPGGYKVDLNKMKNSLGTNNVFPLTLSEFQSLFPRIEPGTVPPIPELFDNLEVLASKEIYNNGNIIFRAGANDLFVGISDDDFDDMTNAKLLEFATPVNKTTFKASPNHILPKIGLSQLREKKKCILGYSMENDKFEPTRFKAIVEWVNTRFEECIVFIGDSIHRNTLMINRNIDESTAIIEAKNMAKEIIEREECFFKTLDKQCVFSFMPASEVQKKEGYIKYEEDLWALFNQDEMFNQSVNKFASTFLSRRKQKDDHLRHLSCTYLIEELAIISLLVRDGWGVFVYPGSLDPFIEISMGMHPKAPIELQSLYNVVLGLKKRGHKVYC